MEGTQTESFGRLLRRYRREAGLTQEELAERAGVSVRTISDLERGISQAPYRATIDQLAEALRLEEPGREALHAAGARHRGPAAGPASSTAEVRLPPERTSLVGREHEVADAIQLLRRPDVRLLTLTGVGGVGKTRLALRVAATLAGEYGDGTVFVSLASVQDPALVSSAVANALGVREEGPVPIQDRLLAHCAERQMLLVLDNFEQVADAALLVGDLLTSCPGMTILVTSRVPLHLQGEQEVSVPPLGVPGRDARDPASSAPALVVGSPAAALFLQRARAVKPDLAIGDEDALAVAEICRRLDGLPLAIELAAARIKALSPRSLLNRLDRRLPLLTGGARDLPARHQTMRDTIAWSYDLLPEQEQQLFRRLAVFVGGCDVRAAEEVAGLEAPLQGLISLVDQSLLVTAGDERFTMLETVREYGLEQLAAHDEEELVRRRHAAYFLSLARQAEQELTGPEEDAWLRRLELEHDNLRAALAWMRDSLDVESGLQLAGALWRFWYARGHYAEGRRWLIDLLERAGPEISAETRAAGLYAAGAMAFAQSDQGAAIELWGQALPLFREQNDLERVGAVLNAIGTALVDAGNYAQGAELLEESLAIRRALGDPFALAATLNNLANLARYRGHYHHAECLYEESLALYSRAGVKGPKAAALNNLALVALELGDVDRAERLSLESLALYDQSDSVEQRIGCRLNLADVAMERRQYDQARALYQESLEDYLEIGAPGSAAGAELGLGQLALQLGDLAEAEARAEESVSLCGPLEWRGHMNAALLQGDILLARGDSAAARAKYTAVLAETWQRGMSLTAAQALDRCGWAAAAGGQWERATLLCTAAKTLLDTTGATWTRFETEQREFWLEQAYCALSPSCFEEASRRGREEWESTLASVLSRGAPGDGNQCATLSSPPSLPQRRRSRSRGGEGG